MEFEEYLSQNGEVIDGVVYLQRYKEGWRDDKWEERFDVRDCIDADRYYRKVENQWFVFILNNCQCISWFNLILIEKLYMGKVIVRL